MKKQILENIETLEHQRITGLEYVCTQTEATALVYDLKANENKMISLLLLSKDYPGLSIENAIAKAIGDQYKLIDVLDIVETRELRGTYLNGKS